MLREVAGDLEQPDSAQVIYELARQGSEPLGILVNNAGLGFLGRFLKRRSLRAGS